VGGHHLVLGSPGVGGDVVVEHHQQEEGDAQHVGKDCKLDVTDHGVGVGWFFSLKYKTL